MASAHKGRSSYNYTPNKLDIEIKNRVTPLARHLIDEPLVLDLNTFLSHLCYLILRANHILSVIIIADFFCWKVDSLVFVLKSVKMDIGWFIANIIGISPGI